MGFRKIIPHNILSNLSLPCRSFHFSQCRWLELINVVSDIFSSVIHLTVRVIHNPYAGHTHITASLSGYRCITVDFIQLIVFASH